MIHKLAEKFATEVRGTQCWQAIAGTSTGSRLHLDFGKKIEVNVVRGDAFYRGETAVQIGSSQWRITSGSNILSSSSELIDNAALRGIKHLESLSVIGAFFGNCFDLRISFDKNLELSIFCNDVEDGEDNYSISVGNEFLSVACENRELSWVEDA